MHKTELIISHGGSESTDQCVNGSDPIIIKRMDGEINSSVTRHDQRERIRWRWEYSKPKKRRRCLHQGNAATMIINSATISPADHLINDQDDHRFNGGVAYTIENPADQISLALLFTLCHRFCQAMVGGHAMLLVGKEAENCFIMCSWGDRHGTRKAQRQRRRRHQHQHVDDG